MEITFDMPISIMEHLSFDLIIFDLFDLHLKNLE